MSQPPDSQTLMLPSGRILGYATFGFPPSLTVSTVLYFHGFPTSRLEGAFLVSTKYPVHVVAIDRPGMGLSSFQPGRKILDWPADVLALVDHLQIEKFHVLGDSGGAPYTLACARDISRERLLSTTVISGIYPLSLGTEGMLFKIKAFLYAGVYLPTSLMSRFLEWEFGVAARGDRQAFEDKFIKEMEGRDEREKKCLDDLPFRKILVDSMREAFRQGSEGPAWDFGLYGDWGFGLEEINGENVTIWHGTEDANTPFGMAERAAGLLKGCVFHAVEEETHLSLPYNHIQRILKDLLEM